MLTNKRTLKVEADFATIPTDKYTVEVTDVTEAEQMNYQKTGMEEVLRYKFAILDNKNTLNDEGGEVSLRGRFLFRSVTSPDVVSPRTNLGKLAIAVTGEKLDPKAPLDPESLVGQQVDVLVESVEGTGKHEGKTFANIQKFIHTVKKLKALTKKESEVADPVVETASTPAVAPTTPVNQSEDFVREMEAEKKAAEEVKTESGLSVEDQEVALAEAKLKAAKARAKAQEK